MKAAKKEDWGSVRADMDQKEKPGPLWKELRVWTQKGTEFLFCLYTFRKKWGLVLVKGEYNKKKIAYLSSFLQKKKEKQKKNSTQNFLFLPWRGSMKHKCVIKVDSSGTGQLSCPSKGHIQRQRQHFTLTFTPMIDSEETVTQTHRERTTTVHVQKCLPTAVEVSDTLGSTHQGFIHTDDRR